MKKHFVKKALVLTIALTMGLSALPVGAVDAEAYEQDYIATNCTPPPEQ